MFASQHGSREPEKRSGAAGNGTTDPSRSGRPGEPQTQSTIRRGTTTSFRCKGSRQSSRVVLADEPSGNLDTRTKNELHQLFFTLREELGQTFVIVTHDTELARMSDRQIKLNDGMLMNE